VPTLLEKSLLVLAAIVLACRSLAKIKRSSTPSAESALRATSDPACSETTMRHIDAELRKHEPMRYEALGFGSF